MSWHRVTLEEFTEHEFRHAGDPDLTWNGDSPGGAAAQLDLSRYSVHSAVNRGSMEGIRVEGKNGRLVALFIPQRAIDRYREEHLGWIGLKGQPIPWLQKQA